MTMSVSSLRESFETHGDEFRVLFRQLAARENVHAYLITGEKGTGKRTLARLMAAAMLCTSETGRPCGVCRNCLLVMKDEHPDLILIEKGKPIAAGIKKDRSIIPVEDIREMIRLCGVQSMDGNMHAVLIFDAESMTAQAQNCLLKTLEEPPPDTCIILVTAHTESILTTVISRCRMVRMRAWEDQYILSVLKSEGIDGKRAAEAAAASDGSIGKALELAKGEEYWKLREEVIKNFFAVTSRSEVLKISNQWKDRKQEAGEMLAILESLVRVMAEARFGKGNETVSTFPVQWQRFSAEAEAEKFILLADTITNARKQLQFNTNFQAVIEKILFAFMGEGNIWLQS